MSLPPGLRGLVVEDNAVVLLDIEDTLKTIGVDGVVAVSSVPKALEALARETIDFAILDYSIGNGDSLAVADELASRGIRFMFMSGHGGGMDMPLQHRRVRVVGKPFGTSGLLGELAALLAEGQGG